MDHAGGYSAALGILLIGFDFENMVFFLFPTFADLVPPYLRFAFFAFLAQ